MLAVYTGCVTLLTGQSVAQWYSFHLMLAVYTGCVTLLTGQSVAQWYSFHLMCCLYWMCHFINCTKCGSVVQFSPNVLFILVVSLYQLAKVWLSGTVFT